MRILFPIIVLLLVSAVLSSCRDDPPRVCTQEFRAISTVVLTPEGTPAESVQIAVTQQSTGTTYDPCEEYGVCQLDSDGEHVIFHDGFYGEVTEEGELFLVTGETDGFGFSQEFVFGDNGCHVEKFAGPDTVYLSETGEPAGTGTTGT